MARICQLARRLGYNDAKTKMLIGQSADNLAELERKLFNELDERPAQTQSWNGGNAQKQPPERKTVQSSVNGVPKPLVSASSEGATFADEGFLF